MSEIRLSSILGPAFFPLAHDVFRHGHTHYDLSGGRGSLKSSAVYALCAGELVDKLKKDVGVELTRSDDLEL